MSKFGLGVVSKLLGDKKLKEILDQTKLLDGLDNKKCEININGKTYVGQIIYFKLEGQENIILIGNEKEEKTE